MSDQRPPLRLGFFSYLQGQGTAAEIYRETLEQFVTADQVGIDTVWVANYRLSTSKGLPSPWVFFTALAERTRNVGFGTAIVTLPAEHPIKVAEDAAVLETLHPGRVNLGVGTGFTPDPVLEAMGFGPEPAKGAVRLSLGWSTTEADIDCCLEAWRKLASALL